MSSYHDILKPRFDSQIGDTVKILCPIGGNRLSFYSMPLKDKKENKEKIR